MIFTQSEGTAARRRFPIYLVDATDGITPETSETGGQPQISKAGGAWANTSATLSALGNGGYYVELTAAELDTLGPIQVRYKSGNTAEFNAPGVVIAANIHDSVRFGLTALPNAAAAAAGGLLISGANTGTVTFGAFTITGNFSINGTNTVAQTGDGFTRLGAPAGASVSADVAAVKTVADAISAKTTNLPTDPADASDIAAATTAIAGYIDTEVAAIKAKTDNLPADPADASDIAAAFASLSAQATAIEADTQDIQGRLPAALVGGRMNAITDTLSAAAKAEVNAEVNDVVNVDNNAAPTAVPAANAPLGAKVAFLTTLARNKQDSAAAAQTVYAEDGVTPLFEASQADDGTTYTRGAMADA